MSVASLFDGIDPAATEERFDDLLRRPGVRIERIVSAGQATPPGQWLEQAWDEWVLLIAGAALLETESGGSIRLEPGDHRLIPAGQRHRVAWTDADRPTVWLTVHIGEAVAG